MIGADGKDGLDRIKEALKVFLGPGEKVYWIRGSRRLFHDNTRAKHELRGAILEHFEPFDRFECVDFDKITPLVIIGFSDGATTIYQVLGELTSVFPKRGREWIDYLVMIDMVRKDTDIGRGWPNIQKNQPASLPPVAKAGVNFFQESNVFGITGAWKGYRFASLDQENGQGYADNPSSTIGHIDNGLFEKGIIKQRRVQDEIIKRASKAWDSP